MSNYPLQKGEWVLDERDILLYLSVFKEHRIKYEISEKIFLITSHEYYDDLKIKSKWLILYNVSELKDIKSIDDIISLEKRGILKLVLLNIISFTKRKKYISKEIQEKFNFVLKGGNNTQLLTDERYKHLEYKITEKTSIPDLFFQDLINSIDNILKFNDYLNNKEKEENNKV